MLKRLYIQNFILIDNIEIVFSPGLNIISGETGSGKSIIVTAIGLAAGIRAKPEYVRRGFGKAIIEAECIEEQSKNTIRIRREIESSGKSYCWINDKSVSVSSLQQEIGKHICIAGQNEQMWLMRPESAKFVLDEFGRLNDRLEVFARLYEEWVSEKNRLKKLRELSNEREYKLDYLKSQVEELKKLSLKPEEEEEIKENLKILKNSGKIIEAIKLARQEIFDGDRNALSIIFSVLKEFQRLSEVSEILSQPASILNEAVTLLGEVEYSITDIASKIQFDETSLDNLQERLYQIERIKKKFKKNSVREILDELSTIEKEVEMLSNYEESIKQIEANIIKLDEKIVDEARKLSVCRKKAAVRFKQAVIEELKGLAFKNVDFDVRVWFRGNEQGTESGEFRYLEWIDKRGGDDVEFLFKPNEGEEFAPLWKIASGGEISRVLLAIKTASGLHHGGETFVFDEIDSGIGGESAAQVGKKLKELGSKNQVICVTHLPQIAAYGDTHILVCKKVDKGRTISYVKYLGREERVEEIARMMSGKMAKGKGKEAAAQMLINVQSGFRAGNLKRK